MSVFMLFICQLLAVILSRTHVLDMYSIYLDLLGGLGLWTKKLTLCFSLKSIRHITRFTLSVFAVITITYYE